ncbi:hypothetical protein POP72_021 [Pectobacterium phage POP72]|uniref:Uncharacterized protein n=2 Tax=Axomammavirus PP1 TaxID=2733578 RepID=I7FXS3_9CAUD|nr:polysaccharide chain length determinant protein [Pectobacterium phage PP1]AFP33682.1 hypothetical protein PP1_019 [Pectobacterium phage PP1]ARB10937.1 hypothetical protein POP72_021 [Pectobacterium phage POP72]
MSLITITVRLSQALRDFSVKLQKKALTAIEDRIAEVQDLQVECEARRSALMQGCHQKYYSEAEAIAVARAEALAAVHRKFDAKVISNHNAFTETKRSVALVAQSHSDDLKRELCMMKRERDHLVK